MGRESCRIGFDTSTNTWKMVCVLLKEYAPPNKSDMVKKNLCNGACVWHKLMARNTSSPVLSNIRLIERSKSLCDKWTYFLCDKLVDLNGEVGYVTKTMEMLAGAFYVYNLKSGVLHKTNLAGSDACPVVHPLRKECYEPPPFPLRIGRGMGRESCRIGFDTSTNTWKMVCVLLKEYAPPNKPNMVKKNLCNGACVWHKLMARNTSSPVLSNIRLIERSKSMCDKWTYFLCDKLVDLNGEVGYVTKTMEVWLLSHKREWVPHCRFKEIVPDRVIIDVSGCWNKDVDILIRSICGNPVGAFYVYNLKSGVLHKTNLAGSDACPGIFVYPNTLSSIHGINANSFSMKTTYLMKSCLDLHLFVT
nr:hypothetical protein [Tanacetum cinerariifolium]